MDDRNEATAEYRYISLADCPICSQLDEVVASYYKYGWDDQTVPLPPAAGLLGPTEDVAPNSAQAQQVKRCPHCGTYYAVEESYEYLVNGSEDETKLTRLTPDQARGLLDAGTYEFLMTHLATDLAHPDAATRRYAGKCWTSYHLERGEIAGLARYLRNADAEVVKGALFFLWQLYSAWWWQPDNPRITCIVQLKDEFQKLTQHPDESVSRAAPYIVHDLERLSKS